MKKLVLAYSGGLDTSYCAHFLTHEEDYEVHAVTVNTGGFDREALKEIESRALELGVHSYRAIDAVQSFYDRVVRYLVFGNILRNNTY
ncbi:MAG: argininosuccinate synthase domain-containing protein, partial [Robiginitalea sp.]|uniref:argininosuccinate synthase domain-containing protein n=1 Tax=Robiginitalea sp. TaxID=1902411 RepID=UPI003C76C053